jgi:hypothetical protein
MLMESMPQYVCFCCGSSDAHIRIELDRVYHKAYVECACGATAVKVFAGPIRYRLGHAKTFSEEADNILTEVWRKMR